jgi:uncharacterized membrane protein YkoI
MTTHRLRAAAAALIVAGAFVLPAAQGGKIGRPPAEEATPVGSIRPRGRPTATQRLALAKITFNRAERAALAAIPGQVIYGELEVDDGNLDYDFEIVNGEGQVKEVQMDAGNGTVLETDEADDV